MENEVAHENNSSCGKFIGRIILGLPAAEIVRTAEKIKADLIVMGTRGGGDLTRMMLGSVADNVVRSATCPVLTFHAGKTSYTAG